MQEKSSVNSDGSSVIAPTGRPQNVATDEGDVDLIALLGKYVFPFWKHYIICSFVFAVIFTALSYRQTPQYEASVTAQVQIASAAGSGLLRAKTSGLGAMIGIGQLAGSDSEFLYNMNFVTSREVADAFLQKYDLQREFFSKEYDKDGNYKNPKKLGALYSRIIGADYQKDKDEDILLTPGPSKQAMYKAFRRVFTIDVNSKEMTVSTTVMWKDPLKAKQWANNYIAFVNRILKDKAIRASNLKIQYLESQIKERPEIEVQNSIYGLIEDELKRIAIAESSDEYAFKVIQRAYLPERRSSPNRFKYLFAGGFFGCFLVLARSILPDAIVIIRKKLKPHA
jgi:uncharacterized protein involved in exopolysaccharide biosynthesis